MFNLLLGIAIGGVGIAVTAVLVYRNNKKEFIDALVNASILVDSVQDLREDNLAKKFKEQLAKLLK